MWLKISPGDTDLYFIFVLAIISPKTRDPNTEHHKRIEIKNAI